MLIAADQSLTSALAPTTTAPSAVPPETKGSGYAAAAANPIVLDSITALANILAIFLNFISFLLTSFHQ